MYGLYMDYMDYEYYLLDYMDLSILQIIGTTWPTDYGDFIERSQGYVWDDIPNKKDETL